MSRLHIARAVLAAAAAAACFPALAADTANITVSATVQGVCKLTSTPNMTLTNDAGATGLDPSLTNTDGTGSATISYKCTKNKAPASLQVGTSTTGTYNGTLGTNPNTIAYSITWSTTYAAGSGFGTGSTANDVALTGNVPYANFANMAAGTYSQTVAITIND